MVISDFIGRLGNNLFQLCAAVGYATKHGVDYGIAPWEYADCFKGGRKSCDGHIKENYGEKSFAYEEIPFIEDVKLFGYFQSESYFKHCEDKIRELLTFNDSIQNSMKSKYGEILNPNTITCSIHVRRGDYIGSQLHDVCGLPYYQNAIQEMNSRTKVDLFLVFSDDSLWAEQNLKGENFIFINGNSNVEDLYLQTQCTHNIICNSTFSWWGAWLNANMDKIVIVPEKWLNQESYDTKDVIPESWVKINVK